MAKLTLAFKDRKLKVFALQGADCLIGRDADCAVQIDSLAVEPQHARIRSVGEAFVVEAVHDKAAVQVNDELITGAHTLAEGDQIRIGKHTLAFSAETDGTVIDSKVSVLPSAAWLQIQSGPHLGRTIRLDKAFTRIGKSEVNLAIIAHRDDGYYLSHLQGDSAPRVNDHEIGEQTRKLENTDRISVGELQLQFFADIHAAQGAQLAASGQTDREQRQFSRIPFDVSVTLSREGQSWNSELIDLSLHGALIRTPKGFAADAEQVFRLAVHLEGGPDISMDVVEAHRENDQLGLKCKDIDVDSITHLRRLVELNLGDPELLERELSALG